jgi:hypothetical protein
MNQNKFTTYFWVRSDTRQIFDARSEKPSDEKLKEYAELYNCEITVIEGTTIAEYSAEKDKTH